jgi:UDP-GlcNAc3NAcA epimerase
MLKCVTIIGARPQFIKASVVSKAIEQSNYLQEVVVHTGQHFDENMSAVFFTELGMRSPEYHLGISGGRHGEMTGRMLTGIENILINEKPNLLIVYGDTNSTLAGALAAAKLHIPIAHVEAGLRSFNMRMPEEINRILTDRISRWLFTPSDSAAMHLRAEGFAEEKIIPAGDVMYDVALNHGTKVQTDERVLRRLGLSAESYVLVTVHRAENTDDRHRLGVIVDALQRVAKSLPVVWPLHPRTRQALEQCGCLPLAAEQMHLIDPVGYLDMVQLEKYAALIATDSGGVQKEAFFHRVPCVTLRDETEWVELVEAGWNRLAPPCNATDIADVVLSSVGINGNDVAPYGNGDAAEKIVGCLARHLK